MRAFLTAVALLLAPSAALAQAGPALPFGLREAEPATPERVSAARREADALLAQGNAADLFENVTDGSSPRVRHRASGLECSFASGGPRNRVLIFPSPVPRGDDVGCNTEDTTTGTTVYATRFPQPTTVEAEISGALASIRTRFPDARPADAPETSMQSNDPGAAALPRHRSARLLVTAPDGRRLVARVVVAIVDGWVIKQRHTAPADNIVAVDLMSELMFNRTLTDLVRNRAASR